MRYGTVPIVARTGGLADSVIDANLAAQRLGSGTGFLFSPVDAEALLRAIQKGADAFRNTALWPQLQRNAMSLDVGWEEPARAYARLFRSLVATPTKSA
jgi:starch synthase